MREIVTNLGLQTHTFNFLMLKSARGGAGGPLRMAGSSARLLIASAMQKMDYIQITKTYTEHQIKKLTIMPTSIGLLHLG